MCVYVHVYVYISVHTQEKNFVSVLEKPSTSFEIMSFTGIELLSRAGMVSNHQGTSDLFLPSAGITSE